MKHDKYCKSFYPSMIPAEKCRWCIVIRQVRLDEYLEAWNEGFGIGFEEGRQKAIDNDVYEQGRSLRDEIRAERIQRGIDKWEEDIDIAYWQGYNNAMIEKDTDEPTI